MTSENNQNYELGTEAKENTISIIEKERRIVQEEWAKKGTEVSELINYLPKRIEEFQSMGALVMEDYDDFVLDVKSLSKEIGMKRREHGSLQLRLTELLEAEMKMNADIRNIEPQPNFLEMLTGLESTGKQISVEGLKDDGSQYPDDNPTYRKYTAK